MTQIQLKTNGASLTAKASGKITSGTVGMPVLIEYDDSWDGLTKTAMFRVSEFSRKRENIGTYTTVPWEVLRIPGQRLEVGIEGRNASGEVVVPTVWASVGTVLRGASSDIPAAPNPDSGEVPSGGGAVIDDSEVSLSKTWSSQKISDEIKVNANSGGVNAYIVRFKFEYPSYVLKDPIDWVQLKKIVSGGGIVQGHVVSSAGSVEFMSAGEFINGDDGLGDPDGIKFNYALSPNTMGTIWAYSNGEIGKVLTYSESVLYNNKQILNEAQKSQARKNIGAVGSVNGIHPDENGNVDIDTECPKVFFEDEDYNDLIEVGDFVVDKDRGTLSVCVQIDVETGLNPARFVGLQEVGVGFAVKTVNGIEPDENGNVEIPIGGGSADGAMTRYVIDIEPGYDDEGNETLVYSGTFDDIVHHYDAGDEIVTRAAYEGSVESYTRLVKVAYDGDGIYEFVFASMDVDLIHYRCNIISRDRGYTGEWIQVNYDKELSDISTALDHIIALQEELIGGDSE